nr:proline-rich receptor-like protein kinase PERK2 [Aegilops tauschii subsp. strangulata]
MPPPDAAGHLRHPRTALPPRPRLLAGLPPRRRVVLVPHPDPRCPDPTATVSRCLFPPPLPSAPITGSDRAVIRAVALVPSPMATGHALLRPRRRPRRLPLPPHDRCGSPPPRAHHGPRARWPRQAPPAPRAPPGLPL